MYHSTFLASVLLAITCAGALTSASGAVVYPMITHVLDVSKGRPGNGIRTQFYRQDENGWTRFQDSFTNSNGRLNDLIPRQNFTSGTYKLVYHLGKYFTKEGKDYYHPRADVVFNIDDPKKLYQVTLIVTPFSYVVSSVRRIERQRSKAKKVGSGGQKVKG